MVSQVRSPLNMMSNLEEDYDHKQPREYEQRSIS